MADWQERITRETDPAIRIEHDVRYALAAPLIRDSALWVDLGCGAGLAAADALGPEPVPRALLVDVSEEAAREAADTVPAADTTVVQADLSKSEDLQRVREAVGDATGVITCFETVEHLPSFSPLIEALTELCERFTVLLSVPNDAFWALENPFHETIWGEGSFAELRTLLPADHVVVHQVALHGSAFVVDGQNGKQLDLSASTDAGGVPTHFLVAFGPRAQEIAPLAAVTQTDLDEHRRWERQRDSDLAYYNRLYELYVQSQKDLEHVIDEREDFRRYIHDLEDRLGLPRSGGALPPGGAS